MGRNQGILAEMNEAPGTLMKRTAWTTMLTLCRQRVSAVCVASGKVTDFADRMNDPEAEVGIVGAYGHSIWEQSVMLRNQKALKFLTSVLLTAAAGFVMLNPAHAVDVDAAKQLARQNNCFKCHAVSHDKDGPAYKKVAEKMKGKPDAEEKLIHHITSGEMAKFPDGHEEHHKIVKTDPPNDMKQIKNLIDWILSL